VFGAECVGGLAVYGLTFGALAFILGVVRLGCRCECFLQKRISLFVVLKLTLNCFTKSYAILKRGTVIRELYVITCFTWVVEIARDAQMSSTGVLGDFSEV
jgi:hypothetical protein